jgi:hypothetical protein
MLVGALADRLIASYEAAEEKATETYFHAFLFIGWPANDYSHAIDERPGQGLCMVDREG